MSASSALRSATLPAIKEALASFNSLPSQSFRLIASFPPRDPSTPQATAAADRGRKQLCILDSSFNPPTKAHLHLALTSLKKYSNPEPPDLLFLLATQNADKPSAPASFEDRLAMMCMLAQNIQNQVDVGVTKHAKFSDKSISLSHSSSPFAGFKQIWLMGYDTITRLMDTKYYPPEHTLKPVYDTILGGENRVMMMVRPEGKWGGADEQQKFIETIEEQAKDKVDIVVGGFEAEGVSSSAVREGVKSGKEEEEWKGMVTEEVAEWIRERKLYE